VLSEEEEPCFLFDRGTQLKARHAALYRINLFRIFQYDGLVAHQPEPDLIKRQSFVQLFAGLIRNGRISLSIWQERE
jgi:hypothetical protein